MSIHAREKDSLEGFESTMGYLAHRLGWDETDLTIALKKYPKLAKCSASKVNFNYFIKNTVQILIKSISYFR